MSNLCLYQQVTFGGTWEDIAKNARFTIDNPINNIFNVEITPGSGTGLKVYDSSNNLIGDIATNYQIKRNPDKSFSVLPTQSGTYVVGSASTANAIKFCVDVSYYMPQSPNPFQPSAKLDFDNTQCTSNNAKVIKQSINIVNPTMAIKPTRNPLVGPCVPSGISNIVFDYTFVVTYIFANGPKPYDPQ